VRGFIMQLVNKVKVITSAFHFFTLFIVIFVTFAADADILLQGSMKIGDNDNKRIDPRYLLTANDSASNAKLQDPRALNPINFNLSHHINLTQIRLLNTASIDASLYFVI